VNSMVGSEDMHESATRSRVQSGEKEVRQLFPVLYRNHRWIVEIGFFMGHWIPGRTMGLGSSKAHI
jgi:hypothetical protein